MRTDKRIVKKLISCQILFKTFHDSNCTPLRINKEFVKKIYRSITISPYYVCTNHEPGLPCSTCPIAEFPPFNIYSDINQVILMYRRIKDVQQNG